MGSNLLLEAATAQSEAVIRNAAQQAHRHEKIKSALKRRPGPDS
jgi:hypothetical protein